MKTDIKVPAMGESISEATVGTILKPSGSKVAMDEEILELETDKVNQVLYAPQEGVVQWNIQEEDVVEIGQVIGTIDGDGSAAATPQKEEKAPEPKPEPVKEASPEAQGSGARISKEQFAAEVKEKKEAKPAPKQEPRQEAPARPAQREKIESSDRETRKKMTKIRKVIANHLVMAQRETAMLTTFNEVDLTEVIRLRAENKDAFEKQHGVKLGFMSFFVKAAVAALQAIPEVNAYIDGDEIVYRNYYDIGIAVGTEKGLVVPVVRDCDKLSFAQIEDSIVNYAKQAREGNLSIDDLQGGGFTITNGGIYGSLLSTPIINYPQSGILGMHKIQKRPVVVDDEIVIRSMMYVALSYDHRIIDGKEAVTFLVHLKNNLEDPARLILGA